NSLAHPRNAELRSQVWAGTVSAGKLCNLDSWSLAPPEVQRQRLKDEEAGLRAAWDKEGPVPLQPFEGLDSTSSSYRNAGAPPPLPKRRRFGASAEEASSEEEAPSGN
ncbi:unnamed protein product, partial [Polarella glacialis]